MKTWSLILVLILSSCSHFSKDNADLKIIHFNIKELDSNKINSNNNQANQAVKILQKYDFNVLSLNEVQYDYPNGKNAINFLKKVNPEFYLWNTSFYPANTGQRALKLDNGKYPESFGVPNIMKYADQWNFGIFPGQYSTALLYDFKEFKSPIVINKLKWLEFNPKAKLNRFKQSNGLALNKKIELFDKNFVDTVIKVGDQVVHLITLHTVPSYHFGNKKSPNYHRNADQLRFLEWYTTGSTDIDVNIEGIEPLAPGAYFVAIGDWNTDIRNLKNPGSKVLKNYFKKVNSWVTENAPTHEGNGYHPNRLKLMLDYIVTSKNIDIVKGEIILPKEERLFLGCDPSKASMSKIPENRVLVNYYDKSVGKKCFVTVSKEYHQFKEASDHYPLKAWLKLK